MPKNLPSPLLEDIEGYQSKLVEWFQQEGKTYPWRETTDPYAILVSELMLQQTRIATVLERNYFSNWMLKFPTLADLAQAPESDVLKAWEGLGYYNRARNLQKAAKKVVEDFEGIFPESPDQIESLPGVGRYTAGAVASFAFGKFAPIVDGNVIRVYTRLFDDHDPVDLPSTKRKMWDIALALTPQSQTREYNSAVMELGQRVCSKSRPCCLICPIKGFCRAQSAGTQDELPVKENRQTITEQTECAALLEEEGKLFLVRESGTRRKGLWRLPHFDPETTISSNLIHETTYSITRYRVSLKVFELPKGGKGILNGDLSEGKWFHGDSPEDLPALAAPYRKVLEALEKIPLRDQVAAKKAAD